GHGARHAARRAAGGGAVGGAGRVLPTVSRNPLSAGSPHAPGRNDRAPSAPISVRPAPHGRTSDRRPTAESTRAGASSPSSGSLRMETYRCTRRVEELRILENRPATRLPTARDPFPLLLLAHEPFEKL